MPLQFSILVLNLAIAAAAITGLLLGQPLSLLAFFFLRDIPVLASDVGPEMLQAVGGEPLDVDEEEPWATDHKMGFHADIK